MGLFSSDRYFKPGKGVEKDAPQKKALFRFFELYFRKFWKYVLVNLIYMAVLLPILFYIYASVYGVLYYFFLDLGFTPEQVERIWTPMLHMTTAYYSRLPLAVTNTLMILSALAYGPCRAGVTYVLRNFYQEKHAWISDIWDKAKENWKQGLFFGLLDVLVFFLAFFNMSYDPEGGLTLPLTISKYLTVLAVVLYCFMRRYIFLMIVTVHLNIRSVLKNAWLLMMIGIFRNVGGCLLNLVLWLICYALVLLVHPLFEVLLLMMFSLTNLINVFSAYPLIQKYMIDPISELSDEQREALMKQTESRRKP